MSYKDAVEEKRRLMVEELLKCIESNPSEWESGWYKSASTPVNGKTSKNYNGINALWLYVLGKQKGYMDPRWVTFRQAKELGASVNAGEKSTNVFYWNWYDKATKKPFDEETVKGLSDEEKRKYIDENVRPILKYYSVFNAEQCENFPELPPPSEMPEEEQARRNEAIERIISQSAAPVLSDGGNRAYYSPGDDSIHLPEIKQFKTIDDYYATALHEIAHSTGHESRLNRNLTGGFGSEEYAKEELRAELVSVFMQFDYDIRVDGKHFENHASYLKSWLEVVRNDEKEFFSAASDAEKISRYVGEHYLTASTERTSAEEASNKAVSAEELRNNLARLTQKMTVTRRTNVRKWYMEFFSDDELGNEIQEDLTFDSVVKALNVGKQEGEANSYRLGTGDTVVRNRVETVGRWLQSQETVSEPVGKVYAENLAVSYDELIDNLKKQIREAEKAEEEEKPPVFDNDAIFSEEVDAVLSGADTTSTHLKVMNTPKILRDVGLKDLPILMTAKHLKSITSASGPERVNYHGLSVRTVKRLPELLSDPVMILDSMTRDDSVVVLTEVKDKENRPIIAAVKVDGKGYLNDVEIEANILTSTYGKDNFNDFMKRNVDGGTVLYWNKEKTRMLQIPGIQFPDNLETLESDTIIRKAKAFVNSFGEQNKEKTRVIETPGIQFPDNRQSHEPMNIIRNEKAFVNSFGEKTSKNLENHEKNEVLRAKGPVKTSGSSAVNRVVLSGTLREIERRTNASGEKYATAKITVNRADNGTEERDVYDVRLFGSAATADLEVGANVDVTGCIEKSVHDGKTRLSIATTQLEPASVQANRNCLTLTGFVKDRHVERTSAGKRCLTLELAVKTDNAAAEKRYETFLMNTYTEASESFAEKLHKNDFVTVRGSVRPSTDGVSLVATSCEMVRDNRANGLEPTETVRNEKVAISGRDSEINDR